MKVKITFIALLAVLFFPANLFSQKPFYPKPNLSNDITFNRKIPQALLNKLNKQNNANKNSYPSNIINYQAHASMSKVLVPGNVNAPGAGINSHSAVESLGSNNNGGNFHL